VLNNSVLFGCITNVTEMYLFVFNFIVNVINTVFHQSEIMCRHHVHVFLMYFCNLSTVIAHRVIFFLAILSDF